MGGCRTVGESVSQLLSGYGIETIFGIPGVHNIELFRNIEQYGIDVVLPRHEQGAAFMADGFARASGNPGVCYSITGPGLTNSMTPLAQSYSDSVPILMVSSSLPRNQDGKDHGHLHEMKNQELAASTVTGLSLTADTEADIEEFCAQAFSLFATSRPRPAYLQIPIDLMDRAPERDLYIRTIPSPPVASDAALKEITARLSTSHRTVILVGGGAINAGSEIRQLAERLGAAVVTTIAGKGVIPESHSRSIGAALHQKSTHEFLRSADVVLILGSELSPREFWCDPLPFGKTVIRIDIDASALSGREGIHMPVLSEARQAIQGLLAQFPDSISGIETAEIEKVRQASKTQICTQRPHYVPLIQTMREALPENALVATDMTMPAYFGSQVFDVFEPRSWLAPNGYGTLGYALPAGIGAKIGAPNRPVAVLAGDYGFQFTMQELAVAVQRSLPVPIIIWNNESLFAIEEAMVQRQILPVAVNCQNPDFCRLAEAMGALSARPESYEELRHAIEAALNDTLPTVIEVKSDAIC